MAKRYYFEPPQRRAKPKAGADLKSLLVRCPSTSKLTDTGRTIEQNRWPTAKMKPQKFTCTHCGAVHSWTKEDVVLGRPVG
ncbi:MAG TPA: hypothetical protein VFX07_11730 [Candidatus Udaeobacter sp.]|jgi:hypothetical protein|nr:hypothetical protein [Candidatus Udaeobacter sp.]